MLTVLVTCGAVAADERSVKAQPTRVRDSLMNGVLIGAGVGFGAGFLTLAAVNAAKTETGPIWDAEAMGVYTSAGLLGAAVGGGIGALIDAVRPARGHGPGRSSRRVDLVPVFDGGRRGLLLAIRR